ncbi:MAG TPA: GMC family oxidoreductase N-terminal domain-containing protein, partial [Vicinamibacteria bacterium]|nr:GMC family oxidoreductase N-terminal domain-containing protein [Vicinamibacteria bacterium]
MLTERAYDVVIVGSGAGGGTVAQALAPLASAGLRVLVLEKGPRLREDQLTGRELEMAEALYEDGGGVLTAEGTLTLAFAHALGGSTTVYTGTSMVAPERVISAWDVPGLTHGDLQARSRRYMEENNVHLLPPMELNDNNLLFVQGGREAGLDVRQFPVNVKGCVGSSLCNLGCANGAKQGTHRVQLPRAQRGGVEVATRAEVLAIEERALRVRVSAPPAGGFGHPPEWAPGEYLVRAGAVVLAAGAVGTPALMLRSRLPVRLPRLGEGFTCHPALILAAEHPRPVRVDVGHPKSFFVDRAREERFVLESCAYFPFTTAKSLVGFGEVHSRFMQAFPRLQMILALACDKAVAGNRVGIDGQGRPLVHYRFTPEVVEAFAAASRAAARIFFGAGATAVHSPLADPPLL